jgi:hypothetical protein
VAMPDRIDTVITDGSLRRLAHERSDTSAPVLIEVAGPTDEVEVRVGRGPAVDGRRSTIAVAASAPGTSAPPKGAASAVSRILGGTPRYLRAARSFAAVATGAQLAALAASPAVAAIRPDRLLEKLPRSS